MNSCLLDLVIIERTGFIIIHNAVSVLIITLTVGMLANKIVNKAMMDVYCLLVYCTQEDHLESQLLEEPPVLAALVSERKETHRQLSQPFHMQFYKTPVEISIFETAEGLSKESACHF